MDIRTFFKKTAPAVKGDIIYTATATLLLAGSWLLAKRHATALWSSALIYLPPVLLLLTQCAKKAIDNKKREKINRHWILFAVCTMMFGSSFIINAEPHFRDTAVILLIYSIGEIIVTATLTATKNPLRGKRGHTPVLVQRNGTTEKIKPELLQIGDTITIKKGDTVPTDGIIKDGSSLFSSVTDRDCCHTLSCGDKVYAGYLNKGETVKIEVCREFNDSTTAVIIEASRGKEIPQAVEVAKTISKYLILCALTIALLAAIVIPMYFSQWFIMAFPRWLYRALLFTAIAVAADTIAFSLPVATSGTFARLLRNDIVVNKFSFFDKLAKLRSMVFDTDLLDKATLTSDDVKSLRRSGIRHITMMSSGSQQDTAATAKGLGIKDFHSEMQDDDKAKLIKHLHRHRSKHTYLAAVGNGDNDRRLLQLANIRIAMTTPDNISAIESNDVAILNGNMTGIGTTKKASRKLRNINIFNMTIAVASKALLLLLALTGVAAAFIPDWTLAAFDVAILAATSLNALRTL